MSEYQFYEFRTTGCALSKQEKEALRDYSSQAEVDSRSARYVYTFGDFPGDEIALLCEHFDAMLYITNWGSRRLLLKLPRNMVVPEELTPYLLENMIELHRREEHLVLDVNLQEIQRGDRLEGEGWLKDLTALKDDIINGELRILYLAWLKACDEFDEQASPPDDQVEPPIPAGLGELTEAHQAFADLYDLHPDWIAAAAEASAARVEKPLEKNVLKVEEGMAAALEAAKTRTLDGLQGWEAKGEIMARFWGELRTGLYGKPVFAPGTRTVAQLRKRAAQLAKKRIRRLEGERRQALEALGEREDEVWEEVAQLAEKKTGPAYKQVVESLSQLNDLAELRGESIRPKIQPLLKSWKSRRALMQRLRKAGLLRGVCAAE